MKLNPILSITKDSEVEVCSEEEGFRGAWYRAILEESPTKSGRKKLRVRYTTLISDDCSSLLTETVEQTFIRPIPPENSSDFVEGSIVDADLKDGWWIGFIVKKLENEKFLVYFDSPPELIQFEKKQLRTHFDWVDSKWVKPENKVLSKSLFSCGTMVEVNCKIDKSEAVWVPAIVVKEIEIEKKLIVKCCNNSMSFGDEVKPNLTVDISNVRPIPPPFFVDEYTLLDRVEAFNGSGWRKGLVRGILSDKRYKVSFLMTKGESVFKHSDLRPSKDWENGVWIHGNKQSTSDSKRKTSETTIATCKPKKLKVIYSPAAATPTAKSMTTTEKTIKKSVESTTGTPEKKMADNEMNGEVTPLEMKPKTRRKRSSLERKKSLKTMGTLLAQEPGNKMADNEMNSDDATTPVIAKESAPHESADINAEPETQEKSKTLEPIKKQISLRNQKTEEKKIPQEHDNCVHKYCKRKKQQKPESVLNKTATQITKTSDEDYNQSLASWILAEKSDKSKADTTIVLPFLKHSPIWKDVESMEIFKTVPQTPHFNPLIKTTREEFREGSAMGKMVTFSTLLEKVKDLRLNVPRNELERLRKCFFLLEKYGFDIKMAVSRIDLISGLKDKQENVVEERKMKEKEIEEGVSKKRKVEEDLRDVEIKIRELKNQETDLKTMMEDSDKEIEEMKLCVLDLEKKIEDVEVEFEKMVEAPWGYISS